FFFQAEDGIRDRTVTGVQTCALPISVEWMKIASTRASDLHPLDRREEQRKRPTAPPRTILHARRKQRQARRRPQAAPIRSHSVQIGRASCRERVCSSEERRGC